MSEHPIQGLMKTAMEHLQNMIDVNTIIGDPVETPDGSVILTVSKVGFGFAAGGSQFGQRTGQKKSSNDESSFDDEQQSKEEFPFGGGSGGGVSITPIAFLIVGREGVKMIHVDESTHIYERLLDLAPQAVEKIQAMIKKQEKERSPDEDRKLDI
ncbi:GerW family sporulation protein [Litoribacterium kuwaitense]|uniref:GerW family sporulation protein n=1 Tax=Litoribacterium kuwaitense TaxID=1398745 RepID=UPI001FE812C6|nr:GerW family sporulation protein [Litoribacterium kuwaitense]